MNRFTHKQAQEIVDLLSTMRVGDTHVFNRVALLEDITGLYYNVQLGPVGDVVRGGASDSPVGMIRIPLALDDEEKE